VDLNGVFKKSTIYSDSFTSLASSFALQSLFGFLKINLLSNLTGVHIAIA